VDTVAASLREFGFRQPIVVDEANVIIVGHTRWKAAQKLGLKQVPVHVARDLPPEKVKAYRIADNQTATLAEWNYDLLPLEPQGTADGCTKRSRQNGKQPVSEAHSVFRANRVQAREFWPEGYLEHGTELTWKICQCAARHEQGNRYAAEGF
jgi:hypothetical protein